MKTSAGEMVINSSTTLNVISVMNQTYQTSTLCTQRFGGLDTLIDGLHFHTAPYYARGTDFEVISTSQRMVAGDDLSEVFTTNIKFKSGGEYFMGSNGDMRLNSGASMSLTTGGTLNLN